MKYDLHLDFSEDCPVQVITIDTVVVVLHRTGAASVILPDSTTCHFPGAARLDGMVERLQENKIKAIEAATKYANDIKEFDWYTAK